MDYREKIVHVDNGLPLAIYHISPGMLRYQMQPHWHPEIEIIAIHQGSFELHLNDTVFDLSEGSVALMEGGSLHSGEPQDCTYTCILVNPDLLMKSGDSAMDFFRQLKSGTIRIFPNLSDYSDEFYRICSEMAYVKQKGGDGYPYYIKSLIFRFWGVLSEKHLFSFEKTPNLTSDRLNRMKNVISFIEEHYQASISLSELAELANLSSNHFCQKFKQLTGLSPISYLLHYRLEKARYALETTDLTVTEIALSCGFNDVSHFIFLFRKQYGKTPKQIR